MCGIVGFLNFGSRPVEEVRLRRMLNGISHRGHDNTGILLGTQNAEKIEYAGIALGHRRLSIIDLSAESNQPLYFHERRLAIVYNGELFNYLELREELIKAGYQFKTNGDTEVVLYAFDKWKEKSLQKFNGMFAFAIWDDLSQELFCARDHIGIKPLYYHLDTSGFAFGSESQSLLSQNRVDIDNHSLISYFLGMYVPGDKSIYSNIKKLLPGNYLKIKADGNCIIRSYWRLSNKNYSHLSLEEAGHEISELMDSVIKRQMISDVPVGAFLSGGFDSGLLVAKAAKFNSSLHTYSVGFDSTEQRNELAIAKSMGERYRTKHHEYIISSSETISLLDQAIYSLSEPVSDSAIVPTYCLSQMASQNGVKVLLTGTGGDEVFGGYLRYTGNNVNRKLFRLLSQTFGPFAGKTFLHNTTVGARLRFPSIDMLFCEASSPRLSRAIMGGGNRTYMSFIYSLATDVLPDSPPGSGILYSQMQFDLESYLPHLLLFELDQLTMAHTLEGRVPYLDIELVEKLFSYNYRLHIRGDETKRIQRVIAKNLLDARTFTEKKQGFSGPIKSWVNQNWDIFRERISAAKEITELAHLNLKPLLQSTSESRSVYDYNEIFALYCFVTWYHQRVK